MFTEEERIHALGLVEEGYSHAQVARIMRCDITSVRRWARHWADSGSVWADPDLRNSHIDAARLDEALEAAVLGLVEAEPVAFLKDHADLLRALKATHPDFERSATSAATVYRILRRNNITRKVVERLFAERVLADQVEFAGLLSGIPLRCLVSIDETHKSGGDSFRRYGRSRRNTRCLLFDRDPRTVPRTSTIMAVSMTGSVLWTQTVVLGPALTADDWRLFLQGLRPHIGQYVPGQPWALQPDACVLLFDNAAIHDEGGDEYLHENGVFFMRLPPYSPDLQPIEGVFSILKKIMKDLVYHNGRYNDFPLTLVATAVSMLTHEQVYGQFVRISDNVSALLQAHE